MTIEKLLEYEIECLEDELLMFENREVFSGQELLKLDKLVKYYEDLEKLKNENG